MTETEGEVTIYSSIRAGAVVYALRIARLVLGFIFCFQIADPAYAFRSNIGFWKKQGSCGGVSVGGACWYYGLVNQSCDTVCAGHGGYSDATHTYVTTAAK